MQPTSDDRIHFVGAWTDEDVTAVRAAIQHFERAWAESARGRSHNIPEWIVVRASPRWGTYYFAHRRHTRDSLAARSVVELTSVIERSASTLQGAEPT